SAIGQRISARFVAGTQVADVLRATCAVNQSGLSVSIDNLGENVSNAEEARASAHLYRQLLDEISARKLNANISLKLTHMGLDVNENLARELAGGLVAKAASSNPRNFVRVDMEGSAYAQRTLDFVYELHPSPSQAGRSSRPLTLNSKCSTASAATCTGALREKAGACVFTSRLAQSGIPTSCAGWQNGQRMCCSWQEIC